MWKLVALNSKSALSLFFFEEKCSKQETVASGPTVSWMWVSCCWNGSDTVRC